MKMRINPLGLVLGKHKAICNKNMQLNLWFWVCLFFSFLEKGALREHVFPETEKRKQLTCFLPDHDSFPSGRTFKHEELSRNCCLRNKNEQKGASSLSCHKVTSGVRCSIRKLDSEGFAR